MKTFPKMLKLDLILWKNNWINEDEIGAKSVIKFIRLRAKSYSYLMHDGSEDKNAKGTKKYDIKRKLKFENYENCLEATQLDSKIKLFRKMKLT